MFKHMNKMLAVLFAVAITVSGCNKTSYQFGALTTPTSLGVTTTVEGVDATNPNGNGKGNVVIKATANNAITYKIDFGDGNTTVSPTGSITYKYTNPGTFDYIVTVNAIGTGGTMATFSKKITVFVAFEIPTYIVEALTGGTQKTWITDKTAPGHVGVGPNTEFSPIWYAAAPNERADCLYDDEITFSKDANNNLYLTIDNKGQSFSIGAATSVYGVSGGDNCYAISTTGAKKLSFMDATSASTSANSTRIQFSVPGNGIINFGTGGNTYEILAISATNVHLRNIGADGNAWYQKLTVKQ